MLAPDVALQRDEGRLPDVPPLRLPDAARGATRSSLGKSTTKDENYELEYNDRGLWEGRAFVLAYALYEQRLDGALLRLRQRLAGERRVELHRRQHPSATSTPGVWILPQRQPRRTACASGASTSSRARSTRSPVHRHGRMHLRRTPRPRASEPAVLLGAPRGVAYDSRDDIDIPTHGRARARSTPRSPTERSAARRRSSSSASSGATSSRSGERQNPILALRALARLRRAATRHALLGAAARSAAGGRCAASAATASSTSTARWRPRSSARASTSGGSSA